MNTHESIQSNLAHLGLSPQEATAYLELLRQPATYVQLSNATGINRTTLYRISEILIKRGLVNIRIDDRGKFLVATEPANLELTITEAENLVERRRVALSAVMPDLVALQYSNDQPSAVQVYEGIDGLKQMLWHELKSKQEIVMFADGTIENLVNSKYWAETYRARVVEKKIPIRLLWNNEIENFTRRVDPEAYSSRRVIPHAVLPIRNQMEIYDDTIGIHYWNTKNKFGVEIIDRDFAQMWRSIFEHYWDLAGRLSQPEL